MADGSGNGAPPRQALRGAGCNAVRVMRFATGEAEEEYDTSDDGKDKAAVELGRKGGKARAASLSKKKPSEIARKAAAKRWAR
jgi:hypothetical protein